MQLDPLELQILRVLLPENADIHFRTVSAVYKGEECNVLCLLSQSESQAVLSPICILINQEMQTKIEAVDNNILNNNRIKT